MIEMYEEDNSDKVKSTNNNLWKDRIFFQQIASGSDHCMALSKSGYVYSWGSGNDGRLGHNDTVGRREPSCIDKTILRNVLFISCGDANSACI
jgi:alpha-tubulin suppressor-like RCC1 family protein